MLMHVKIIRPGASILHISFSLRNDRLSPLRRHTDGRWEHGLFGYHGCGMKYRPWKEEDCDRHISDQ
jgi:hypothetical protein